MRENPLSAEINPEKNQVFTGLSKFFNTSIKTIKKKVIQDEIKKQDGSVILTNKKGEAQ